MKPSFLLSNKMYDVVKFFVQIVLPASASLYFGLSAIYGFPGGEEVVGTIALVTTFLGTLLGISTRKYNASDGPYDGNIVVTDNDQGGKLFTLNLDGDPGELVDMRSVTFRIDVPK